MAKKRQPNISDQELAPAAMLRERVALRAYELYELRDRESGFDLQDWFQAEQEILPQLEQSGEPAK
ncbi:MAG TPA: DUF2934 domain-containing protein [Blastocatellia bacterium]|nr:DUF2934 domain-containing protein [Blastocatellia bacterium]